jgi:hypothetical protein
LPEAGGILVRQFDPENLNEAYAKIREVIMDPEGLARWEEQVRREFRPVPWTASAEALLVTLGYRASPDVVTPVRSGPIASDTR